MNWYVLQVKGRREKQISQMLNNIGLEAYCPTYTETRIWSDRKKQIEVPLFTSYVFVRLDEKHRNKVFAVPGIARYLFWLGKPAIVKNEEIDVIQEWLDGEPTKNKSTSKYRPGQEIVIEGGRFKDRRGIVLNSGNSRLRLILTKLNLVLNIDVKEIVGEMLV